MQFLCKSQGLSQELSATKKIDKTGLRNKCDKGTR